MLVFGAGAIGGYIGVSLALRGHPVTFIERPHNISTLKANGLRLTIGEDTHHLPDPSLAPSPRHALESGPFDIALFALKSYDTAEALEALQPLAVQMPPLLCLQNGVDNEADIAEVLGPERVIAGTVTTAVGKLGVGELVLERKRGLGLSAAHLLSERLAAAFNEAGLNARLYADPLSMKWSKLLTNLLANAQSAIFDLTPAQLFADPSKYRAEVEQLREALAVMDALKLKVVDLPGTPVRALAFAIRRLPPALSRPLLARAVGAGRGAKMPSLHIDLHSGKGRSEVGWLNGAVLRWGEQTGVPTPINQMICELLQRIVDGETPAVKREKT